MVKLAFIQKHLQTLGGNELKGRHYNEMLLMKRTNRNKITEKNAQN